jgi:hypothetical protein
MGVIRLVKTLRRVDGERPTDMSTATKLMRGYVASLGHDVNPLGLGCQLYVIAMHV